MPLQTRVLDRWPDGSARWILLDWLASVPNESATFTVYPAGEASPASTSPLRAERAADGALVVRTGRCDFTLRKRGPFPFADVRDGDRPLLDCVASGLVVTDSKGTKHRPRIDRLEVETSGPVRLVLKASGPLERHPSKPLLEWSARMHFIRDSAAVEIHLTLLNPRRAGHRGGRWALGSSGSIYVEDASINLAPIERPARPVVRCSPEPGMPFDQYPARLSLYQDSSGGANWNSSNHRDRNLRIPTRFRGYSIQSSESERTGLRATPVTRIGSGETSLAVCVRHFWQNFPMSVDAGPDGLVLGLFPRRYGTLHEIQGGEQKTHVFVLSIGDDRVTELPLDWCRAPLLAHADPDWYAESAAVPFLLPRADDSNANYLQLVDAAIDPGIGFVAKRERIDEYGWRNFGDLYADHETLFHEGSSPLVSHYNNQYDAIAGFALQFLRSGDRRWFDLAAELSQHVVDIDIYRTDRDKAAYNGGLFWHTSHYTDAHTGTHRGAPTLPGVAGGGPSPGHLYTSGLLLNHFLTGDPTSREAVLDLGRYVLASDDGRRSRFRFLSHAATGLASGSGFDDYHGPGRAPGNSVNALVDAHRLSSERPFLEKAEELIRRCIHPCDDLEARNLLDAEHRWFYTVFLVAIGKYLDHKQEIDEIDASWEYARASLLHYARWSLPREYAYLEKPEILEFPTETWAAQDMRKSEVFNLAARHTEGEERREFLARARYFFDRSVEQLSAAETRTFCRPVVLLLTLGRSQAWFDRHSLAPPLPAPDSTIDFGSPVSFIPQKQLVKRRLVRLLLATAAAALIAATLLLT